MRNELMILMYHRIVSTSAEMAAMDAAERIYTVTAADFEEQLCAIARTGWQAAGPADFLSAQPGRKLLITFDDSPESHYTMAFPALERHGMTAVFFVTVGEIGKPGSVTWEHLSRMRNAGMGIESHGFTHRFMPALDESELSDELTRSREEIAARLGREPMMLSFPGGRHDKRVVNAAMESGYEALFGSELGINRGVGSGVFRRIPITEKTTPEKFAAMLRSPALALLPAGMRYGAARIARRFIGEGLYSRLRAAAIGSAG